MSVINIQDIRKFYGSGSARSEILHGLNLTIEAGEFVAITGPSGSGKSTLMNILGLLDVTDEGTYSINDQPIGHIKDGQLADLRLGKIGFVFQNFNLISSLSVLDNLQIPLIYNRVPRAERRRRIKEMLTYMDIGDKMRFKPNQLSGGQQQRVAIARALLQKPSIILADEPTGNLDSVSGQAIMDILKNLNKEGSTVVMITHDPTLAQQATRVVTIRDGAIVSDVRNTHEPSVVATIPQPTPPTTPTPPAQVPTPPQPSVEPAQPPAQPQPPQPVIVQPQSPVEPTLPTQPIVIQPQQPPQPPQPPTGQAS